MKDFNRTELIAMSSLLAASYAIVTIFAPIPQYQAVQLRFADCLEVVAFFLGWAAVIGLSLGCLVANLFSPYGLLDMMIGTFSTFLCTLIVMRIGKKSHEGNFRRNLLLAMVVSSGVMGVIIGYLLWIYGVPFWFGVTTVTVGELVAKVLIGYPIGLALPKLMPQAFYVKRLGTGKNFQ